MKITLTLAMTIVAATFAACTNVDKANAPTLRILYVGQNPDTVEGYTYGGKPEYLAELKKTRAADYMAFLEQHFDATLVYGEDYKPSMSDDYDVTLIDALPMELDGKDMAEGTRFEYASPFMGWNWLPEDFDAATVFIAGTISNIADDVSLKMTTLCHCLGKHAFNINIDHPIFNSPYKVDLTYEDRGHAGGVFNYYSGHNLPEVAPMWRVGIDNIDEDSPYPPGHVSNPGVHDSPDAEVISGGVSIKSQNAVAIARQGSFLAWGFRQSPSFMTEEARLAFINAVHYIAPFKGAEKFVKPLSAHRLAGLDGPYLLSDQGTARRKANHERMVENYEELLAKVENGTATEGEVYYVQAAGPGEFDRSRPTFSISQSVIDDLGDNWSAYLPYFEKNRGYIVPEDEHGPVFTIDTDAQSLGIANDDPDILDKAIQLLESGEQLELANRILSRYTNKSFATAAEWRRWYDSNRDKLFFTEVGGYKFMVDIL